MNESVISFAANNLSLFGFNNYESSLFQAVKEMLENALDACKQTGSLQRNGCKHEIIISITSESVDDSYIKIQVMDSGCGIENPLTFLECFNTSKIHRNQCHITEDRNKDSIPLSGRFGLGLSMCLLYSCIHSNCDRMLPLHLRTRCAPRGGDPPTPTTDYFIADYIIDNASGMPFILRTQHVPYEPLLTRPLHGTSVEVSLPRPSPATLPAAMYAVHAWLLRLARLPGPIAIDIKFRTQIPASEEFNDSRLHETSSYACRQVPVSAEEYAQVVAEEPDRAHESLMFHSEKIPPTDTCIPVSPEPSHPLEHTHAAAAFASDATHKVSATILLKSETGTSNSGVNNEAGVLPLRIWRYANSSPLLDPGEMGSNSREEDTESVPNDCAIWAAVVDGVQWQKYGQRVKLRGTSTGSLVLQTTMRPSLIPTNRAATSMSTSLRLTPKSITVLVNLDSLVGPIEWAGLRKMAVAAPPGSDGVRGLVAKATMNALNALRVQISGVPGISSLLLSPRDQRFELMASRNVPAAAEALTRLWALLPADSRERAAQSLGLPAASTVTNTDTGELEAEASSRSAVKNRLQNLLLKSLHDSR